jgi:hypothetical protein
MTDPWENSVSPAEAFVLSFVSMNTISRNAEYANRMAAC